MNRKICALSVIMLLIFSMGAMFASALPSADAGPDGYGFFGYALTVGLDASGSTGDDLSYTWSCKTGTADEVVLGTDVTIYPEWDLWKQCCAGAECALDETFQINLEILDIHGDTATDSLNLQVKEFPFALAGAAMSLTPDAFGEFSGSAAITGGDSIVEDYIVDGPFNEKTLTPAFSKCTLNNANMFVDPITGHVTVTATEGQCKWNILGLGTDTIYCDSWIASMIILAYKEAGLMSYRPVIADDLGDLNIVDLAGNEDEVPVEHLEMDGTLSLIDETTLLDQVYEVSNFAFEGVSPGTTLETSIGVELNIHWKNNEFIIESGDLSNVVAGPANAAGLTPITSADVAINTVAVASAGNTPSYSGLIGIGDYAEPPVNEAPVAMLEVESINKGNDYLEAEDMVLDASGSYDPEGEELVYTYTCNECTTVLATGTGLDTVTIPYEGGWEVCTPLDNRGFNDIAVHVTDPAGNTNKDVDVLLFNVPLWQAINTPDGDQDGAKFDYSFSSSIVDEGGEIGERMYTYFDLKTEEQYIDETVIESKALFADTLNSFADFFIRREPYNLDARASASAVDSMKDRFNIHRGKDEALSTTMDNAVAELDVLAEPLTKDKLTLSSAMLPGLPAFTTGGETVSLIERDELPARGDVAMWYVPNRDLLKMNWNIVSEQAEITVAERAHRAAALLTELSAFIDDTSADNSFAYTITAIDGTETTITAAGAGALGSVIDQLEGVTDVAPYEEEGFDGDAKDYEIMSDMDIIIAIIKMYQEVCLIGECPN